MMMFILMTATIVAVYWFWIRPILKSRPAFAEFYAREESVFAAVREKLKGIKQKLSSAIVIAASAAVSGFLSEVKQSAACNAVHTVQQRVCRWILRMNDLVGMKLPMTQELLAGLIGVMRTSVTAAAASLQAEGIIKYSRGNIQIVHI